MLLIFNDFFSYEFQQLLRSQNPALTNTANGQHMPPSMPAMAAQQQFLAQQNAAYAQQAPYMLPGQDGNPFMATMLAPQAYYGVPPWVYPASLIPQQGTQPRRPLTPSQGAENQPFVSIYYNSVVFSLLKLCCSLSLSLRLEPASSVINALMRKKFLIERISFSSTSSLLLNS